MSQQALTPVQKDDFDEDALTSSLTEAMGEIAHNPVSLRDAMKEKITPLIKPAAADPKRQAMIEQQIAIERASPAHKANLLSDYFRGMLKQSEAQLSELRASKSVDVKASREKTDALVTKMQEEIVSLDKQKARLQSAIESAREEGKQFITAIEAAAQTQIDAQQMIVTSFKNSLIPFERGTDTRVG